VGLLVLVEMRAQRCTDHVTAFVLHRDGLCRSMQELCAAHNSPARCCHALPVSNVFSRLLEVVRGEIERNTVHQGVVVLHSPQTHMPYPHQPPSERVGSEQCDPQETTRLVSKGFRLSPLGESKKSSLAPSSSLALRVDGAVIRV